MRHCPPGWADKKHRKATFNAALEQSEQLHAAAGQVGPATRPILLFYSVAQFGRAIAAASPSLPGNTYRLSGHGLKDANLDSADTSLVDIPVRSTQTGAFPDVARALGCAPMSEDRKVGELWAWIPDSTRIPLPGAGSDLPVLRLDGAALDFGESHTPATVFGVPTDFVSAAQAAGDYRKLHADIEALFAHYPDLAGWRPTGFESMPVSFSYPASDDRSLDIKLPKPSAAASNTEVLTERTTCTYHGSRLLYPAVDDSGLPMHPLLIWWAVLFVMSRLARYQPREWDQLINIAKNPQAAGIEYLLSEALLALPELGLDALYRALRQRTAHD